MAIIRPERDLVNGVTPRMISDETIVPGYIIYPSGSRMGVALAQDGEGKIFKFAGFGSRLLEIWDNVPTLLQGRFQWGLDRFYPVAGAINTKSVDPVELIRIAESALPRKIALGSAIDKGPDFTLISHPDDIGIWQEVQLEPGLHVFRAMVGERVETGLYNPAKRIVMFEQLI